MEILVAVPAVRINCKVTIDRARPWSVVDELILWSIYRDAKSIDLLASESNLPSRLIVASIARMMRFRLVEIVTTNGIEFRASDFGYQIVSRGEPLPYFQKIHVRRVGFVVERTGGEFFQTRDLKFMSEQKMDRIRDAGTEIRRVVVTGGEPVMDHDANFNRLSDIVSRGWGDQISNIDGLGASVTKGFVVVRYLDHVFRQMPVDASERLKRIVSNVATGNSHAGEYKVAYFPSQAAIQAPRAEIQCTFNSDDLIIGSIEHRNCLIKMLAAAKHRIILHSTFILADKFSSLLSHFRSACERGVTIDILWGGAKDEQTEVKNQNQASEIMKIVRRDPLIRSKIKVHLTTTGSHSKFILIDANSDSWIGVIGSCNWLYSSFDSVELSVILREPHAVAELAVAIQRIVGQRGLEVDLATEMALVASHLRTLPRSDGSDRMRLVIGEEHEQFMRRASGEAMQKLTIGSNRIGSTLNTGAIMPGEVAASNGAVVTLLYYSPSGPLRGDAEFIRVLPAVAGNSGVKVVKSGKNPKLHGKFIAWDDDDLVVTSMNWASASGNVDFPLGEIGVYIHSPGISAHLHATLLKSYPGLATVDMDKG